MGIRIEDLKVGYGPQAVIDGLCLQIERGSFFTLLGPSGCGKTTLLRTIAGFVSAQAGRVFFGSQDVTRRPAHQRDIGMVFQDYALFPDKTVFDNVAYGLRARRQDSSAITRRVGQALERVGLDGLAQRHPAVAVLMLCGVGYWWLEPNTPTLADGLWLAFTTAATVGFGDVVPSTPASRIFSAFVVMLGYGVLSLATAAIATTWIETEERRIEREILRDLHQRLGSLHEEIAALRQEIQDRDKPLSS